jgi:hypothetical protein
MATIGKNAPLPIIKNTCADKDLPNVWDLDRLKDLPILSAGQKAQNMEKQDITQCTMECTLFGGSLII